MKSITRLSMAVYGLTAVLICGGCGGGGADRIVVGSKHFTEQKILGEMICRLIEERTDLSVRRRLGLQGTKVAFAALREGDVDVYPEYTGTGLINILNKHYDRTMDRDAIRKLVSEEFEQRWGLTWLRPLGFANTYAYAMRDEQAESLGVTKISDLDRHAGDIEAGFDHEYTTRPEYKNFEKVYGFTIDNVIKLDPDLTYRALKNDEVDLIDAFSTDGRIQAYDFRLLEDDKDLFPPYDACFVVGQNLAKEHPGVVKLLRELEGKITAAEMQQMNFDVTDQLRPAEEVAEEFLRKEGLIE